MDTTLVKLQKIGFKPFQQVHWDLFAGANGDAMIYEKSHCVYIYTEPKDMEPYIEGNICVECGEEFLNVAFTVHTEDIFKETINLDTIANSIANIIEESPKNNVQALAKHLEGMLLDLYNMSLYG